MKLLPETNDIERGKGSFKESFTHRLALIIAFVSVFVFFIKLLFL